MSDQDNVANFNSNDPAANALKKIKEGKKKAKQNELETATKEMIAAYDTFLATKAKHDSIVDEIKEIDGLRLPA